MLFFYNNAAPKMGKVAQPVYWCEQVLVTCLLVSSSRNPIMTVERRHDQNGNGHLIEKPMPLGVIPLTAYDNPVLEESLDYLPTVPNGQCHHPLSLTSWKSLMFDYWDNEPLNLDYICYHHVIQRSYHVSVSYNSRLMENTISIPIMHHVC